MTRSRAFRDPAYAGTVRLVRRVGTDKVMERFLP